jgi:hypothetical protein
VAKKVNSPISKLIGSVVDSQTRMDEKYRRAHRRWKKIQNLPVDAANRLSRDEAHERRR